jgi:hypothetical protein
MNLTWTQAAAGEPAVLCGPSAQALGEGAKRPDCSVEGCSRAAMRLCDFPVEISALPGGKPARCYAPLCDDHCAADDAPHLCPKHRGIWWSGWRNARDMMAEFAHRAGVGP